MLKLRESVSRLRTELELIGIWASYDTEGYHEKEKHSWINKQFTSRGDPIQWVFDIENNALREVSYISPDNLNISLEDINTSISCLNQWISSFNSTLREIREFKYSRDADKNVILHNKLKSSGLTDLTPEENAYSQTLVDMYTILHFNIIGDEATKSLYFWYKNLIKSLTELQTVLKSK